MKAAGQLVQPGKSDYELVAEILTLQYSNDYSKVSNQANLEYIFDPDKFDLKDVSLVTENYSLEIEKLQEFGMLATKLRQ